MRPIDANDAAFPSFPMEGGLTKREYFAARVMQGLLANSGLDLAHDAEDAAHAAVLFADELLKRLGEKP